MVNNVLLTTFATSTSNRSKLRLLPLNLTINSSVFTTMLIGEFESKLTEKNRIAVPKKIRTEFEGDLVLSRGYEGCLILLDQNRWDELIKLISVEPILNLSVRDTRRFLMGSAYELELDQQGRFVVPASLRDYSDITSEVVFLGLNDWVEVWSKQSWEKKLDELSKTAGDIAEKLLEKNNERKK